MLLTRTPAAVAFALSALLIVVPVPIAGQTATGLRARSIERLNERRVIAGEVLVRFRATPTIQALASLELSEDERLLGGIRRLRARRGGVEQLLARLAARPDVVYAEPNYLIEPVALPRDPFFPRQTGFINPDGGDVRAIGAWDGTTGSRVGVIALLDSGADVNHPDLIDNMWSAPAPFSVHIGGQRIDCPAGTHGFDAIALTCDQTDQRGHGTAMAGIIGATGDNGVGVAGVNWTASIMPVKFIDANGFGSYADAIRAIDFAMQVNRAFAESGGRIRVLSASWRGMSSSQALADAVTAAGAEGMLLVAASGNDGADIDVAPVYPAAFDSPHVIAVAATSGNDLREPYSNVGVRSVDLAAPGSTYTTVVGGGYGSVTGTSTAAAFVSGAAHLLLSRCRVDTATVRALLLESVDAVEALRPFVLTSGRLNAGRAIAACRGVNEPPSVSLTEPTSRQVGSGDTVHLHADAHDPDGTVSRVDFFVGSTWLGHADAPPFAITAGPWPLGIYRVTAVASDDHGATATSGALTVTILPTAVAAPSPWQHQDIGHPGAIGAASGNASALTVSGAGADVWGTSDAFSFVYQRLTGDGEIVARVSSVEYVNAWTKAGVMIRESLAADSGHAFMLASAGKGIAFQRRAVSGGLTTHTSGGGSSAPVWTRLTRVGQSIAAAISSDGVTWTTIGTETVEWAETVYAGVAVSSHRAGVLATATFDAVTLAAITAPTPLVPRTGQLPQSWSSADIGAVGVPGASARIDDQFHISGAGADIWGTADAFQFAFTTLHGDGDVIARVVSVDGAHAWTKAGVMIRASLEPDAAHAFALVSAAKGAAFQRRTDAAATSVHTAAEVVAAPLWVRLTRTGGTVTASTSTDGQGWTVIAADTISLAGAAYVGLAVSSHDPARIATAAFDNVDVIPAPGAYLLPAFWSTADVGHVGVNGAAEAADNTFVLAGAGADIWGTTDAFRFAYTTLPGNGRITARVRAVDAMHAWTKAGVMVRQSLDPGSPHGLVLVSAAKGLAFQRRQTPAGLSLHEGGVLAGAPHWVRLVREGALLTAMTSADGDTWSVVGSDVVELSGSVHAGLAVTSHDVSRVATAVFTDVVVESD